MLLHFKPDKQYFTIFEHSTYVANFGYLISDKNTNNNFICLFTELLTCQRILSIMVFLGFMTHHMIRVNMSIAIVQMAAYNISNTTSYGPQYNWDEESKNDILGYFFWGYVLTQVPGGRLSELLGTKVVVGCAFLIASLLTILTPLACSLGYYWLLASRFCLGFVMGVHWPSTPPLASKWIPPSDTSTFMSHMTASSLGVAITLPICGYLIKYLQWPSVFYATGAVALTWTAAWFYFMYDSPEQHPRISRKEKEKLKIKVKCVQNSPEKNKIPWKQIFCSGPVWAFICANTFAIFSFFIVLNQLPTYMSQVLHFNITQNGWFSSLPYLGKSTLFFLFYITSFFIVKYCMALTSSFLADKLKKTGKYSTTSIRKFLTTVLFWGMGSLFVVQALWGNSRIISIIVFSLSLGLNGLTTPGIYANCVDIAPAYSGTIFGISQIPISISGYVTTKMVAVFTKENQGFEQWAIIFWILVGMNFFASFVFLIFASGEEQKFNIRNNEAELQTLQTDSCP